MRLEKLLYQYKEDHSKYEQLSSGEKNKRIKALTSLTKENSSLIGEILTAMGNRGSGSVGGGQIDLENGGSLNNTNSRKLDTTRGADGELENTRGLDNHMLLQQQKNMLEYQD